MKKHLLIIVLLVAGACVNTGGSGPKEDCKIQYSSNGAVISQLKPDYSKAYLGRSVRYNLEVTNLGEKKATNTKVACVENSQLSCPPVIFGNTPFTLNPPDPTACIGGETKSDYLLADAQLPTGEEPAYLKLSLSYAYESLSWAEVTVVSESQWKVRTQQGIKPVQSKYQSASPVKIEIGVPDAPVVFNTNTTAKNEFPVTVILKSVVEGYGLPQTAGGTEGKVDYVKLTAPTESKIFFISDKCAEGATPTQTCTLNNAEVSTEEDAPKTIVVNAKITSFTGEEEIYKITAKSEYTEVVYYASPQGVEILTEYK